MQELARALTEAEPQSDPEILDAAARTWAAHALGTYKGQLLKRALAISAALADFTAEMGRAK